MSLLSTPTNEIHVPPSTLQAIILDVTPDESRVDDLNDVATASLRVKDPSGTETDLVVVMSNRTSRTLRITHQFTTEDVEEGGCITLPGLYSVWGLLTITGFTPVEVGPFIWQGKLASQPIR
jgi:hypothetical protein